MAPKRPSQCVRLTLKDPQNMLSREVGSVAHLSCRIKGNIFFTQEFSAMFILQPLALSVVGGKNYLCNAGLRNIFCLKRTHSSYSQRVSQRRSGAQLLDFPQPCCQQILHCLKHRCSAVLTDPKAPWPSEIKGLPSLLDILNIFM